MGDALSVVPGPSSRSVSRLLINGRRPGAAGDLAVIVHRSPQPGSTVVITANIHGDECGGVAIASALDAWLASALTSGSVVLYPSCNPQGLAAQTRVVPTDDGDLNRMFPGNARGGWTSRLAATLWRDLSARRPALVIDLHADAPRAVPYAIIDRPVRLRGSLRTEIAAQLERLAAATGFLVLREFPDELYLQFGLDHSLAGAVVNQLSVPALTLEIGPRRWLDPGAVGAGIEAVKRVLAAAGVVAGDADGPTRAEGPWRRTAGPRVRRAGWLRTLVAPGGLVRAGEVIAHVVALTGEVEEEVLAPEAGVLVSWVEGAWVQVGGVVGTLGVRDPDPL